MYAAVNQGKRTNYPVFELVSSEQAETSGNQAHTFTFYRSEPVGGLNGRDAAKNT